MLNREQRKVLAVLNQMRTSGQSFSESSFYNGVGMFDREKMVKLCGILKEEGYLAFFAHSVSNEIQMIDLSYRGIMYQQEVRREILKYIGEKWIDFFALLASVAALVISIISLLSIPPS